MNIPIENKIISESKFNYGCIDTSNGMYKYGIIGLGDFGAIAAAYLCKAGYKKSFIINNQQTDHGLNEDQKLILTVNENENYTQQEKYEHAYVENQAKIFAKMKDMFGDDINKIEIFFRVSDGFGMIGILTIIYLSQLYLHDIGHLTDCDKRIGITIVIPKKNILKNMNIKYISDILNYLSNNIINNNSIGHMTIFDEEYFHFAENFENLSASSVAGLFHLFNTFYNNNNIKNFDKQIYDNMISNGRYLVFGLTALSEPGIEIGLTKKVIDKINNSYLSENKPGVNTKELLLIFSGPVIKYEKKHNISFAQNIDIIYNSFVSKYKETISDYAIINSEKEKLIIYSVYSEGERLFEI